MLQSGMVSVSLVRVITNHGTMNLIHAAAIGLGAALGAVLRWLLGLGLNRVVPALPMGTLAANLLGALLMGMAMALFNQIETIPLGWRLALTTGFLGGLTTFSSFSAEAVLNIQRGEWAWTAALISAHVIGSLLLTLLGFAIVQHVLRT